MNKVLIADSQALAVAGTRYLIEGISDFSIMGEVSHWQELTTFIRQNTPDILIFDYLCLANFSTRKYHELHRQYPSIKLFAITADQKASRVLQVLQANTSAFLTKNCSREEIQTALEATSKGQRFYCETVLDLLMQSTQSGKDSAKNSLSDRELQIIKYIAREFSTQEIADQLNLSHHTINAHRKRILKKLHAKTPIGIVVQALQHQLIHLEELADLTTLLEKPAPSSLD